MNTSPLTTSLVARRLGISENAVRKLDAQLAPQRTANGIRLYLPDVVEAFASARSARVATK